MTTLFYFLAIVVGTLIGYGFGRMQIIAKQRYLNRQEKGHFNSGITAIPGSMQRTAIFLIVLILIQIGLPMLFKGNIQWLLSAGVMIGYGWSLFRQYHQPTNR